MLAVDLLAAGWDEDGAGLPDVGDGGVAWPAGVPAGPVAGAEPAGEGEVGPEGEDAPDLVAFAKALDTAGVKFFGAAWCPACTAQKELFDDGQDFLPFIEVTNPDRSLNQVGIDEDIASFPTWEFPDESRLIGVQTLETLSQRSAVPIPSSSNPFVAPIEDTTVFGGSPLHVALNGYDPNGDDLTWTVTSSDPDLVQAQVLEGNRSAEIRFSGFGATRYQLFEQRAARASGRFIELAESGFYNADQNEPDQTAHRIIDNFIIQFGDPTGTGAGGSNLPDFRDDFDVTLQHNNPGGLSWAKAGDDTNNSQIFIIDVVTRFLDGNHSYFGQLTEGESNRDAANATATDASDRPINPVVIQSVDILNDTENGIVMLTAAEGASGEADITVTAEDSEGNQFEEMFHVTVAPDPFNMGPFIDDMDPISTSANTPVTFQLNGVDTEGDPMFFEAFTSGSTDFGLDVDNSTGEVTVTPPAGFVGQLELLARVRPLTSSDTADVFDNETLTIDVHPAPPLAVDLKAASDSGESDTDNITSASPLTFDVTGVVSGSTVILWAGNVELGRATANGTATITTTGLDALGDGDHVVTATQVVDGLESDKSPGLTVTLDQTAPTGFATNPPVEATVGVDLAYDVGHDEEGSITYALIGAPEGATIGERSGVVTWSPTAAQQGNVQFGILAQDAAGNSSTQNVDLDVVNTAIVQVRLEVTDAAGDRLDNVDVDQDFFLRAFVEDLRFSAQGVFAAFADVDYDATRATVIGNVVRGPSYPNVVTGSADTPGMIDELGSAAGFTPLGSGEFLLWTVPMRAERSGTIDFDANPPDLLPANAILVFGQSTAVPLEDVRFVDTSVDVNLGFGANNDLFNVDEDSQANTLDPLDNDDLFGSSRDDLVITQIGTTSQGGTVEIIQNGKRVNYVPPADFFGNDEFTYTVSDGDGSDQATVTVQVHPLNDPPDAVDDAFTVQEDSRDNFFDVSLNDSIAPDSNETLTVIEVSSTSQNGTVTIGSGQSHIVYSPPANFFGEDTFTYTISDGNGGEDMATVTVTVVEENDPPLAGNDVFTFDEDTGRVELNVLVNDSTQGDENETLAIQSNTAAEFGNVVFENGRLFYEPPSNFTGLDRFTYIVSDGNGGTAQGNVSVQLLGVNDPPSAVDDFVRITKDTVDQTIDVLANDSGLPDDPDEALTIVNVGPTSNGGTVTIVDGASVLYSPAPGFMGTETFTYTISDPEEAESQATVTVEVVEFEPGSLAGIVYLDVNNNGIVDVAESRLGEVSIILEGTDDFGEDVRRETVTDGSGNYSFDDLAPGIYTIIQVQPPLLLDGIDSVGSQGGSLDGNDRIRVVLPEATDGVDNNFGERGRRPEFIGLIDCLASSPVSALEAIVDGNGEVVWYASHGDWTGFDRGDVQRNGEPEAPQIEVSLFSSDSSRKTTIPLSESDVLQILGRQDDLELIRVAGSMNGFEFIEQNGNGNATTIPPEDDGSGDNGTGGGATGGGGEAEAEAEAPPLLTTFTAAPAPVAPAGLAIPTAIVTPVTAGNSAPSTLPGLDAPDPLERPAGSEVAPEGEPSTALFAPLSSGGRAITFAGEDLGWQNVLPVGWATPALERDAVGGEEDVDEYLSILDGLFADSLALDSLLNGAAVQ